MLSAVFINNVHMKPYLSNNRLLQHRWQIPVLLTFVAIYGYLFYLILTHQYLLDFSSLYSSSKALSAGENPYEVLLTTYFSIIKKLPANLNPPIVLWLVTPLANLNYDTAVLLWCVGSFVLGLICAGLAFNAAFSPQFLKDNRLNLYLIYLSFFAVMMDTAIAQLGSILLFFVMYGYHFYCKKNDLFAGIMWGIIIAFKLFPGLLFLYAVAQRRYKLVAVMLAVFLLLWLLPLLIFGTEIYTLYYAMLKRVLWYGDNWNSSLYGFIFRLMAGETAKNINLSLVNLIYTLLFSLSCLWYWTRMRAEDHNQQAFALTIVMMLLLSPFGWLYYLPLVIFPLALTWVDAIQEKIRPVRAMILWLLCLFLINFPIDYVPIKKMNFWISKLTIYSVYFYGLLLLAYLTSHLKIVHEPEIKIRREHVSFIPGIIAIFSFVLMLLILSFIVRNLTIHPPL